MHLNFTQLWRRVVRQEGRRRVEPAAGKESRGRRLRVGSSPLDTLQTFHLLPPATSKTEPPRYRKCAFRRLQFELMVRMEPAVLGVWRTLSCETSGPTTRRPTLTHRGQGPSLGRLGKYPAHPLTGAQHIGRAFWAAMGGHALVGSASGKGELDKPASQKRCCAPN